ncbi:MAG: ribbon-helix-helix protein, CopG family [Stenomitos rutilans HA7619-LM2]|jgi:hypothetical protein|nr:ribbon-helix-helix protein, CopG family [Stenomitos rutilans HA7619-LM2]
MVSNRSKAHKPRQSHQRKRAVKGVKSRRGCPELYDELKQPTTVALTPTAVRGLDELSAAMQLSRSELVERIGRKLLTVADLEALPLTQEVEL